ncbi:glyoxalase/bleomycin resistance/extradiol dioxygenase family protein [Brachybacterium sp. YJGR34]|uniref:VOC family protein n=1 Tax=Brachybacterium sp. YJGR34 TaxID=2059911 RepID=UPI000E0B1823|nr:VOC family protein [Brachybacterium sp. YJGR34]
MSDDARHVPVPAADWGRTVVVVRDQEASLRYYRDAFGAHILHDSTVNGFRYLHLGIGRGGLWLIAASEHSADAVGRQTGGHPLGVVYVSDVEATIERAVAAGAKVVKDLVADATARYAHVSDIDGNEIVLVQILVTDEGESSYAEVRPDTSSSPRHR